MPKGVKGFQRGHKINLGKHFKGHVAWNKGKRGVQVGANKGKKFSKEWKDNLSKAHSGQQSYWKGRKRPEIVGDKNPSWKGGKEFWKKSDDRNDGAYQVWRLKVHKRDNYKCQIKDKNCKGRIEVHHILGWTEFPELRYKVNNGITLCHFHHPRKRVEEIKLISTFQGLVMVKE